MERETLEVDVLFVGAGPASLSAAYHLTSLLRQHNRSVEQGSIEGEMLDPLLLVLDKGREIGSHALSGAVVDPRGFDELLADRKDTAPPYDTPVREDALYYLTERRSFRSPWTPPPLRNEGSFLASLGDIVRWLSGLCEERGVEVYPGFPAVKLLLEGEKVVGVRTGDRGIDRQGERRSNFEPGIDIRAGLTLLGEGPRGTLARQAVEEFRLDRDRQPQLYAVGVKELWQLKREVRPGQVFHTLGFPLPSSDFGGGFLYTLGENRIAAGFVVGIDSPDPTTDSHRLLQQWKLHPLIRGYLEGGELLEYGAKSIPEGGYYAVPRSYAPGLLLLGDSAGLLNSQRLKGIHLGVKSGMLAAETAFESLLKKNASDSLLEEYERGLQDSWAGRELYRVRNFRQSFQKGFWKGAFHVALQQLSRGRGIRDPFPIVRGDQRMRPLEDGVRNRTGGVRLEKGLTFDKVGSVYHSDTSHEEDQPSHLKVLEPGICTDRCAAEFGNPCQHFCPASVYEMVEAAEGRYELQINFSNCVHCKTCEIADPYQVILWTPPEGGGGPDWKRM